ncbi:uncharacterized protein LOC119768970, partial [Culex quinquefasciatus]|uniref:uncharacterized protein LOC119768970 n=1 Tax=Culex quinquefasciatus TaxID=7176 RepID=UPI0018E3183F
RFCSTFPKKRWKALRDTYRRELQKIPVSRSGDAANESEKTSQHGPISPTNVRPLPRKKMKTTKNNHAERLLDIENKTHKERDEDETILESLLPHLRKLTPDQKLRCRMELQNVVLDHAYPRGHNDDLNMYDCKIEAESD